MLQNVNTVERAVSVVAGAALLGLALKQRRYFGPAATTGAGLLARGASGYCPVNHAIGRGREAGDTREVLGGPGGTHLQSSVMIHRPAFELYRYWRQLENLPAFIRHLESVEEFERGRSHWVLRGPAGTRVEWDAEIVNEIEPDLIAWRTLPGADLVSAGSVRFRPHSRERTEVLVKMQYEPPAGAIGNAVAWLSGYRPASELRDDLERFKLLAEARRFDEPGWKMSGQRLEARG